MCPCLVWFSRLLVLVAGCSMLLGLCSGADPKPPATGNKIAAFTLKDTAGKDWSLGDVKDRKAVVVLFIGTECPINNAYMPRLAELHRTYAGQGVQFIAINANSNDTPQRVAEHARQNGIPFPVLKDVNNQVADQFAAERTPEAFVLDGERLVRYRGRIDDQYGIGYKRPNPTHRDLADAIDMVLAGKAVGQPTTPVAGCLIARAPKPREEGKITYSKEVARILQKNCQECHRPGQIGPMPLLTYNDAAAWSGTIREVLADKRMPPWLADPKHGKFSNDRSLPAVDRDALLAWIDAGCPRGNPKDLPAAREFASDWSIGKPDMIISMPREYTIPAEAKNGIKYQYFIGTTDFKEDVWVQAAEARPGNRAVVHHIIVQVRKIGVNNKEDGIGDGWLTAYAPGDIPTVLPPGTARKIPKGSVLIFQMHYTPNGTEQTDRSSVGLVLAKEPPRQEVRTRSVHQKRLAIPPGEANYKAVSSTTFQKDALLLSMFPHMHLRGKSFEYRVVYPDGKEETLLSVPRYDFGWQSNYRLEKPMRLPAGTRIDCTAVFDNSSGNPNNPDPTKTVRWGDQTWDEMMIGFVDYVYLDPGAGK